MATNSQPSGWVGWVYFAGILMLVRAFFQAFLGIVALTQSNFYVVTSDRLAVYNFTAWGWIHLAISVILLTAAFSVFAGNTYGRIVGSLMVAISLVANLIFLPAYPVWSIVAIIIDSLILYALVVRGAEAKL